MECSLNTNKAKNGQGKCMMESSNWIFSILCVNTFTKFNNIIFHSTEKYSVDQFIETLRCKLIKVLQCCSIFPEFQLRKVSSYEHFLRRKIVHHIMHPKHGSKQSCISSFIWLFLLLEFPNSISESRKTKDMDIR